MNGADEMDLSYRHAQELEEEREMLIERALDEAKSKGVCLENLRILSRETGAVHWALTNSLRKE